MLVQVRNEYVKAYEQLFRKGLPDNFEHDLLPYRKFAREWSGYLKTMHPSTPSALEIDSPGKVYALYALADEVYKKTLRLNNMT